MSDEIVLKVDHVSKTFKLPHEKNSSIKSAFVNFYRRKRTFEKQQALNDISFTVQKGDFFGIVGRNGSGKSTLLKMLAGIYSPSKGSIYTHGKLTPFIELGVGFNPELTGRENVFLNGALLGFSRKEMAAMYDDIVEFAEIKRFMDQKLKNYSSGMQVRLAFSIAIQAQSDILLLDEVLAVGDSAFQQKCFDYFLQLKQEKKTVIFVSHDMSAVTRFCTRAIYVKDGDLIQQGSPWDIAEKYKLENIQAPKPEKNRGPKLSPVHKILPKITKQTDTTVSFSFSYASETKDGMYIGFSVLKDGISVAEMTTSHTQPLHGSGEATYELDTTAFNPGVYQLTVVLCRVEGRKLLNVGEVPIKFKVDGTEDITRAAALKLANTWKY
ncbi:MAG TPA: ABC transporter ATP-binding protein [Candidatus Saccharimonadales bacterium]